MDNNVYVVDGIRLGSTNAGIKYQDRDDLVVIEADAQTKCTAVFTQNAFCAAPVQIARQHLETVQPKYLVINSGNANAGTGVAGYDDALSICQVIAEQMECSTESILPFSTGVIGERLPVTKIQRAIPEALSNLAPDGWQRAAKAIMTTDTVAKVVFRQFKASNGHLITLTGMAKGVGMICPNMATMLAYLATDAMLEQVQLDDYFRSAVNQSFNRISVDGDTSTNDACVLLATGRYELNTDDHLLFDAELTALCEDLAQCLVRDGEGATKLITIEVCAGLSSAECLKVAYTIAHSPLVKTAFFASDPNWGRILAAVGRSGVENFDIAGVSIYLDDVCVVKQGEVAKDYQEVNGQKVMAQDDITIRVDLARGDAYERLWTCDFSYDYVKINAEYRT